MAVKPTIIELILNATAAGKAMLSAASASAQKTLLSLTKSDVGLANVDNTSDANKPVSTSAQTALDAKADLVGGVVPSSQIPAIAISEYLGSVASQSAMLALDGDRGDWCLRSDTGTTFVLSDDDSSLLASWVELNYPTAPVTSVNGETGAVTLSAADVGAAATSHTHAQSDITNLTTDLAAKAAAATTISAGTGLTGGGSLAANRTLNLANTAVTPGSYTAADITVDATGRLTAAANGSSGSPADAMHAQSSVFYNAQEPDAFGSAVTITANVLYLFPTCHETTETWNEIYTYVNGAGTGGTCRLGIYTSDHANGPTFTLLKDAGTVSVASTGLKTVSSMAQSIAGGKIVYLGLLCDVTWTNLGTTYQNLKKRLIRGHSGGFNFGGITGYQKASTPYASGFPASVTSVAAVQTNCPTIGMRI